MRILFIPTVNPDKQGDLLEVSLLHGLRSVLGENLIDYPRKKIIFGVVLLDIDLIDFYYKIIYG